MIQLKHLNKTDNDYARRELNACLLLLVIKQTLSSKAAYSRLIAGPVLWRNGRSSVTLQFVGRFHQVLNTLAPGIFQPSLTIERFAQTTNLQK